MGEPQSGNPAEMYERYYVPAMFLPWTAILLRHANLQLGERVLDVACGTGIVARQAAPLVGAEGRVVGLDMNPTMLAVARSSALASGLTIEWREGNAMALPFQSERFDAAFCQHGLQFMPDRAQAMREMRRVLKPGGRALVIVLQALQRHPVFEALGQSVARQLALPVSAVMTPFSLWDADELRRVCTMAGFQQVDVYAESVRVRFPEPERFAQLAVMSSAAVVPAFTQLAMPERAALIANVATDIEPIVQKYRETDVVTFPMFAHLAVAVASAEDGPAYE